MAQVSGPRPAVGSPQAASTTRGSTYMASVFGKFSSHVKTRTDANFLYVESDGLPAHNMMVGITAWQQQVPLPQPYLGDNAWRIPLNPVVAKQPQVVENHFLRGAIALAVNGIPIFNPQNNRGEVSYEIGELDQWGGHCGRADDYHYHIAPLHLQEAAGKGMPVAYALDGYPIYGLTEPDGSALRALDICHGHEDPKVGYHYHGSTKRPYLQSAFHGEVVERDGQVDPQPRAQGVREALQALRGAKITGFAAKSAKSYSLQYTVANETRYVNYTLNDDKTVKFDFVDGRGQTRSETYSPRQRGPGGPGGGPGGGGRPPGDGKGKGGQKKGDGKGKRGPGGPGGQGGPPRPEDRAEGGRPSGDRADVRPDDARPRGQGGGPGGGRRPEAPSGPPLIIQAKHSGNFSLRSPGVTEGAALPIEFTGDGEGSSPSIEWKGAPAGTKSFAVVMDHLAPGNEMKCYWTIWDIPPEVTSLPKNSRNVGTLGTGFRGRQGYEPPHSQGPGLKTYTIHVYALATMPRIDKPTSEVTREVLLTAIKDSILDSADLNVTYTKPGGVVGDAKGGGKKGGQGNQKKGKQ